MIEMILEEAPTTIEAEIKDVIRSGGGGGTTNYNLLTNKPQINGVTLQGNKSLADLGIDKAIDAEVAGYVEAHKAELKGEKGDRGADGNNGKDGINGKDGVNGTNGKDGADGIDGFSPVVSIVDTDEGAVISITDSKGTKSAILFDGKDGKNGADGKDGKTPVKNVDYFDGKDGKDGTNGKDGSDYVITSSDYEAIADVVLTKLTTAESVSL